MAKAAIEFFSAEEMQMSACVERRENLTVIWESVTGAI